MVPRGAGTGTGRRRLFCATTANSSPRNTCRRNSAVPRTPTSRTTTARSTRLRCMRAPRGVCSRPVRSMVLPSCIGVCRALYIPLQRRRSTPDANTGPALLVLHPAGRADLVGTATPQRYMTLIVPNTARLAPFLQCLPHLGRLLCRGRRHLELLPLCAAEALEPDLAGTALLRGDSDDLRETAAADRARHHVAAQICAERIGLLEWRRGTDRHALTHRPPLRTELLATEQLATTRPDLVSVAQQLLAQLLDALRAALPGRTPGGRRDRRRVRRALSGDSCRGLRLVRLRCARLAPLRPRLGRRQAGALGRGATTRPLRRSLCDRRRRPVLCNHSCIGRGLRRGPLAGRLRRCSHRCGRRRGGLCGSLLRGSLRHGLLCRRRLSDRLLRRRPGRHGLLRRGLLRSRLLRNGLGRRSLFGRGLPRDSLLRGRLLRRSLLRRSLLRGRLLCRRLLRVGLLRGGLLGVGLPGSLLCGRLLRGLLHRSLLRSSRCLTGILRGSAPTRRGLARAPTALSCSRFLCGARPACPGRRLPRSCTTRGSSARRLAGRALRGSRLRGAAFRGT